jgi:hypothetical protein
VISAVHLRVYLCGGLILVSAGETSAACRRPPPSGAATENRVMVDSDSLTLSDRLPRVRIALAKLGAVEADVLTLQVAAVRNPNQRPVDMAVSLSAGREKPETREIGRFSLFPPDRPGTFTLRVPPPAQELLAMGDEARFLVIELLPDSRGRTAGEREVRLGEISWSMARGHRPG